MKQTKVVICNLIMIAISIAAIVTLVMGSFWTIKIDLNIDGETLSSIAGDMTGGENPDSGMDGNPEGSDGSSAETEMMTMMMSEIEISLPITIDFKSLDLLGSITGDGAKVITDMITTQVNAVVDTIIGQTDQIVVTMTGMMVDLAIIQAKEYVAEIIEQDTGLPATEEEIAIALNEIGISEEDIATLESELDTAITTLLSGEISDVSAVIENSETFDTVLLICATEELSTSDEPVSDAEIQAKAEELKQDILNTVDETIEQLKDEYGEINTEDFIVSMLAETGMEDENGEPVTFESMDDVKAYLNNMIVGSLATPEMEQGFGLIMMVFGVLVLIVVVAWAYFLLKLIVKTLFARQNKTVGMFVPRFFGWMPHVFLVGLPMLAFGNLGLIAETAGVALGEEMIEMVSMLTSMVQVNITSLTWVSALGACLLLVILFPYYRWRSKLKKIKRQNKKMAKSC